MLWISPETIRCLLALSVRRLFDFTLRDDNKVKMHLPWKESANEKIYFMHMLRGDFGSGSCPADGGGRLVYFQFFAPQAKTIRLAGDFNQWDPILMRQRRNGWWSIQVRLPLGLHQYRFLVDDKPLLNAPAAPILNDEEDEPVALIAVR